MSDKEGVNLMVPRSNKTKDYVSNNEFSDSKFMSQLREEEDEDNSNNISVLQPADDSMMYATVQQRHKPEDGDGSAGQDIPQYKAFMMNNKQNNNNNANILEGSDGSRNHLLLPDGELVVTQALDDISGYLNTNTFRKQGQKNNNSNNNSYNQMKIAEYNGDKQRQFEDEYNPINNRDDGFSYINDTDPALEAANIFHNVLKNQKSNYAINSGSQRIVSNSTSNTDSSYSNVYNNNSVNEGYPANEVNSLSYHDFESAKNQKRLHRLESVSDDTSRKISSTSSLSNMSTSSQTPPTTAGTRANQQKSVNEQPNPKAVSEVPLITPESIGLVFNQANGLWQEPESQNHDITNSHTVENTTSNTSTHNTEEYSLDSEVINDHRFENKPKNHRRGINSKIIRSGDLPTSVNASSSLEDFRETKLDEQDESGFMSDDTSLTPPKIDRKYIIEHKDYIHNGILTETASQKHFKRKKYEQLSPIKEINRNNQSDYENNDSPRSVDVADVTSVSQFDGNTSYHENKVNLLSILTEVVNDHADWSNIKFIDLSDQNLQNLIQLGDFLPKLYEVHAENNYLSTLQGLPSSIVKIYASNNSLSNTYMLLNDLIHLEELDLSNNRINSIYQTFDGLKHLRKLSLSFNDVSSIGGLDNVFSLKQLDLSSNRIEGVVDFAILRRKYESSTICWLDTIEILTIKDNRISKLLNINHLKNLKTLNINGNPIECITIDPSISSSNQIECLGVDGRCMKAIDFTLDIFSNITEMVVTGINHCFSDLPLSLEKLTLVGVSSSQFDDSKLREYFFTEDYSNKSPILRYLEISGHSTLMTLPEEDMADKVPFLRSINLKSNNLTDPRNVIKSIPTTYLETIDISGNNLETELRDTDLLNKALKLACPYLKNIIR